MARVIAESHHERWNGGGYPNGLRGDAIPIEGRIVTVCDVFDALTHERPYKPAWTIDQAIDELLVQRLANSSDARLVDLFLGQVMPKLLPGWLGKKKMEKPLPSEVSVWAEMYARSPG